MFFLGLFVGCCLGNLYKMAKEEIAAICNASGARNRQWLK